MSTSDDEDFYEELDDRTAIVMGVLSELTRIADALEHIAATDGVVEEDNRTEYVCGACGETVHGSQNAVMHAIQSHDAPFDDETAALAIFDVQ